MSHRQAISPGGPGCCGGGSVTHMQKTHTQGEVAGRHAAYTSPPAAEAGGRQYRDATETCSCAHAAVSSDTHMHIMLLARPEASLRLRGWMDGYKGKQSIQLYEKQHKNKTKKRKESRSTSAVYTLCVSISHIHLPPSFILY